MKVLFATEVLANPSQWRDLDRIVDLFFDGRHEWVIDDPSQIEESAWVRALPGYRGEALYKYYTSTAYRPPTSRRVVTVAESTIAPDTYSTGDAIRSLHEPLHVVVENIESDFEFFTAMVRAFERDSLAIAMKEGWLKLEHGGGSTIPKVVAALLSAVIDKNRVVVLSDSDRLFPGHCSKLVQAMIRLAQEHGVSVLMLERREIENYLPVSALPAERKPLLEAFHELTLEQRAHYDMKEGFRTDGFGKAVIPDGQEELFRTLRESVLTRLKGGFGKSAWRYFANIQTGSGEDIRLCSAQNPNEISGILDQIEERL